MNSTASDKVCITVEHVKRNDRPNIYIKYYCNKITFGFLELKALSITAYIFRISPN